jgi:hypothetical protein
MILLKKEVCIKGGAAHFSVSQVLRPAGEIAYPSREEKAVTAAKVVSF